MGLNFCFVMMYKGGMKGFRHEGQGAFPLVITRQTQVLFILAGVMKNEGVLKC